MAALALGAILASVMTIAGSSAFGQDLETELSVELFVVPGEDNTHGCRDGVDLRPEARVFAQNTWVTYCALITNTGTDDIVDVEVEVTAAIEVNLVTFPFIIDGDYTDGIGLSEQVLLGVSSRTRIPETTALVTVSGRSRDQVWFADAELRPTVQPLVASTGFYIIDSPGATATVTVTVDSGAIPISDFYLDLEFDEQVVLPLTDELGSVDCASRFVEVVTCDLQSNRLTIFGAAPGGTTASGQTEVAEVTFVGIATGTSRLSLDDPFVTDASTGQAFIIPAVLGEISVQDAAPAVLCQGQPVTINMQAGDDGRGTGGPDVILGTDGDDNIKGRGGDDVICAGAGNDKVWGGRGNDQIHGGDGADKVWGGRGNDQVHGGHGSDDLRGGRGNDQIHGGDGNDDLRGGRGNDQIHGADGNDKVWGGRGNDDIHGGDGNDALRGGPDVDSCNGGVESDTIKSCESTSL